MLIIVLVLFVVNAAAQRPEPRRIGNPTMIKNNSKTKNIKKPTDYWLSQGLLDTIPLRDSKTRAVKGYAVYEQGTNISGKPSPRLVGYLDTKKKKIAAKPRGASW